VLLFGIGYGAYLGVDVALAVDTLPQNDGAAKNLGIWHMALVLPQVIGFVVSGTVVHALKAQGLLETGYTAVFVFCAIWVVMGTVFVRRIRGVR
jgi:uncharacterized membrane protein